MLLFFFAKTPLAQTVTVHGGTLSVASGTSLIITSGPAKLINNAGGFIDNDGTIVVAGEFKNNGTSTFDNSGVMNVGGNFSNNGSNNVFVNRDKVGMVILDGTATQTLSGNTIFENLTFNNTAAGTAITFTDDQTVQNTITFTDGIVETGANSLISTCITGSVIPAYNAASFINGNLRKYTGYSNCLNFDGADDYIDLGDNIEALSTLTFETWVYYASGGSSTYDELFSKDLVSSLSIWRGGGDKVSFKLGTGAAWFDGGAIVSNAAIPTDTWTHIAVTWDQAATSVNIYINGALDKTALHTHSAGSIMGSNGNSRGIGSFSPPAGELFKGKMDELRVWNAVRSQLEIQHLMYGLVPTTATDLIAYYRFEDGAAAPSGTLTDVTTNTYDGTLTNMDNTNDWMSNTLHNTFPFPVGNGSTPGNYYLAEMELTSLTAGTFSYLDIMFGNLALGGTLALTEETTLYTGIGTEGEWHVVADNAPTSVKYNMKSYITNFAGLADNQFTVLKRTDGSSDAADWSCSPCGFSAAPADGIGANDEAGRLVADGFALRRGFSSYSKFGIAKTGSALGPLPIELLSFNAILINEMVKLEWETASEINNDFFTIERSDDGIHWKVLNHTAGAGFSNVPHNYFTFDNHPYQNITYYRLKQTDYDGQYEYSHIESVSLTANESNSFAIYPNPFTKNTTVKSDDIFENASYTIKNVNGQTVMERNNLSGSTITISRENLPSGIYFIYLTQGNNISKSDKLVIKDY